MAIACSNALALTANKHARHVLCNAAGFRETRIRPMPAGMIGVVTGGAPFTVVALPAGGTMQHRFVRSGVPVLVEVELDRNGGWCRRPFWNQSRGAGDGLEAPPGVPLSWEEGEANNFLDS